MYSLIAAMRAARTRPPDQSEATEVPLGRLVLDELAWAARTAIHPVKTGAAAAVAVGVGALLGPTTPGPVLGAGWRLALAVMLGFVGLAMAHALLRRAELARAGSSDQQLAGLRTAIAVVVVLLAGTFVIAYLLAAVTGAPPGPTSTGLSSGLAIDAPLLVVSGMLFLGVATSGLGERFAIPGSLLFLALGMFIGSDGLGLIDLSDAALVQSVGVVALVVILFDGGLSTTPRHLRLGLGPGMALATVGVAITAGITAVGAIVLLDLPSRIAWLLGAIVASTDASAVFAMIRRAPIPERLAAVLQIESGANDPVAILLTVGLLASWNTSPSALGWLEFGALQLLGGITVGAAVGWLGARVLRQPGATPSGLRPILSLAIAGIAYGAAAAIGASGFFSVYVAGIVLAAESPRHRTTVRAFIRVLSGGVEVGLFLLLGLLVFPAQLPAVALVSIGITALLVVVARPLATVVSLAPFGLPRTETGVIAWLGMRGAAPIVLSTLTATAQIDEAQTLFHVVFFVVVLSTVLQATCTTSLLRWLRVRPGTGARRGGTVVSALPLNDAGVDVVELDLDSSSSLVARALSDTAVPTDIRLVAIVRGERVLLPEGSTVLLAEDRLVMATRDQERGIERIEAWVAGLPDQPDADLTGNVS